MEKSAEQLVRSGGGSEQEKQERGMGQESVRLPTETSPYVQYTDLEDYKLQGYGTQGHLEVKPGRGAGTTDAPTPSGAAASMSQANNPSATTATDSINQQGVP